MSGHESDLASRLDSLYEWDREPVAASELEGSLYFAGLSAGEMERGRAGGHVFGVRQAGRSP